MESRLNDLLRACQSLIGASPGTYPKRYRRLKEAVKAAELETASSSVQPVATTDVPSGAVREVDPGEGYRLLDASETIQDGDEYWSYGACYWSSGVAVGKRPAELYPYNKVRRKLDGEASEKQPPGTTTPMGDATAEQEPQVFTNPIP